VVLAEALDARQAGDLEVLATTERPGDVGELADLLDDGPWNGRGIISLRSFVACGPCGVPGRCPPTAL
jgi:hypothetical protein